MSVTRNIVKSFRVEVGAAETKCHANSKHRISTGEDHFAYDPSGRINICKSCAPAILNGAELHIEKVPRELELI